ncbi:MAG: PKD domain-containing protein, partial [Rhodothermia bacterium]|nr:PKD domain-containing protein [Rhodothermia bacterium]
MKYVASILGVTLITILLTGIILRSTPQITRISDATISVRVEDGAGAPLPRARVQVFDESASEVLVTAFTDSTGIASVIVPTGVTVEDPVSPQTFSIDAAYPNPVGSAGDRRLTIAYSAPISYTTKPRVEVFDILGRRVGPSSSLSSGVYLYRLDFGEGRISETRTVVVTESGPADIRLVRNDRSLGKRTTASNAKAQGLLASFVIESDKPGYVTASRPVETGAEDVNITLQMGVADRPEAAFAVSGTLEAGTLVSFDGTSSSDPAGADLQYSWDFGNGKRGGGQRVTHTYLAAGSYDVTLVASGSFGATDTTRQTIVIAAGPQPISVTGKVSGIVLDQLDNPLPGVAVTVVGDTLSAASEASGNVSLDGIAVGVPVFLRLEKQGYSSQQVKILLESDTTTANFRAALIERNTPLRISNVEDGAAVAGADGARLEIPYDGLIDENGSRVTGDVVVSLTPVDVVEQTAAFPGRFEAVNQDG